MKKLLILIIAVLLIGLSGYSQTNIVGEMSAVTTSIEWIDGNSQTYVVDTLNLSAGDELILSSKNYYAGVVFMGVGGAIIYAGSLVNPKYSQLGTDNNKSTRRSIYVSGGILVGIGIGYIIESHIHIKRAGLILNENGIGIKYKL